jgi:hypothetical protein
MHCDSIMSYLYDRCKLSDNVDRSRHLPSRTHSHVLSLSSQVQDLHEHCAYCCISGRIRCGQPSYGRDPVCRGCLDHWLDRKCIGPGRQLLINTGQIKLNQLSLESASLSFNSFCLILCISSECNQACYGQWTDAFT